MSDADGVARVVMLWPAELKEAIQAEVGRRGLTAYVLEAIQEKRKIAPKPRPKPVEVPVQVMATCPTCGIELAGESCWVCGS